MYPVSYIEIPYSKIIEESYNNTLIFFTFTLSVKWLCAYRSKKPKPVKPAPKPAAKPKLCLFDEEDDPDKELFQPAVKSSEWGFWIVLH